MNAWQREEVSSRAQVHYAGLKFYLDRNTCSLTAFGTFPISSFIFHFVLSENNLK